MLTDQTSDSFTFYATSESQVSNVATVTVVDSSGSLVVSNFLLSNEDWTIVGNKMIVDKVKYEPYSRDSYLNRYILGTDDKINTERLSDKSLFYFSAPQKFLNNQGISYGGVIRFTLGFLSGNFTQINNLNTALVELYCSSCDGPIYKGVRLFYPLSNLLQTNSLNLGKSLPISLPLKINSGWLKDSQDLIASPITASKCDLLSVLSRLSGLRILGDFTYSGETVALDSVALVNLKSEFPLCAMIKSDASVCTC